MESRVTQVCLVPRQQVALAPEAADSLDAADEGGAAGGHHAFQLVVRRPIGQEPRDLLFDGGVELIEVVPGQRRGDDAEEARDF